IRKRCRELAALAQSGAGQALYSPCRRSDSLGGGSFSLPAAGGLPRKSSVVSWALAPEVTISARALCERACHARLARTTHVTRHFERSEKSLPVLLTACRALRC